MPADVSLKATDEKSPRLQAMSEKTIIGLIDLIIVIQTLFFAIVAVFALWSAGVVDIGAAQPPLDGVIGASYTIPTPERPASEVRKRIGDWLQSHWFMSIATVDASGAPHVSGVTYYVENFVVYFRTRRSSTKAENLLRDPRVAYTVWDAVTDMKELRALQVIGRAREVTGAERDRIARALAGAPGSTKSNLEAFFARAGIQRNYTGEVFDDARHVIFAIEPEWARYNDNTVAMGHSEVYQFATPRQSP
jgi:uncharacterized protein YhbP (UPF0306 family)